jgi:DNA-binding CsgD family transcriptional regulator
MIPADDLQCSRIQTIIKVAQAETERNFLMARKPIYEESERRIKELGKEASERNRAEEALRKRERELEARSHHLKEVNTALTVLLKQREEEKKDLEENVLSNMKKLVIPHLERLKQSGLDTIQATHVRTLESNLNNIVSPFISRLSSRFVNLTPMEIRVADLIKEGKTNKEIGEMLYLSPNTIKFHRYNVRTKLGLKNKRINLRSYLLSLAK